MRLPGRDDDVAAWRQASSLEDLGVLTAAWFEGQLDHPGYWGPPDPETAPLRSYLADLNRAGLVTVTSQPACVVIDTPEHGTLIQRAALEVLTTRAVAEGLFTASMGLPWLHCQVDAPDGRRRWRTDHTRAVPVTVWDGAGTGPARTETEFGSALSRRDLHTIFPGCRKARAALNGACQVTLVDRAWPAADTDPMRLWAWLADFIEGGTA